MSDFDLIFQVAEPETMAALLAQFQAQVAADSSLLVDLIRFEEALAFDMDALWDADDRRRFADALLAQGGVFEPEEYWQHQNPPARSLTL